jgi:tetratricopeptide (TPR) repeat protein
MKKILLFIYFLLPVFSSSAQQKKLDSLLTLLNQNSREDTVRLNLLNKIANAYSNTDPEKGLETADRAISLARKLNNENKLAVAYTIKGYNYDAKGEDSLTLNMYTIALNIHERLNNKTAVATMCHNIGNIYFNFSEYGKALEYQEKSMAEFKNSGDLVRQAIVLNSIGLVYQYLAEYPKALEYFLEALRIYNQLDDTQSENLANVFVALYKQAENKQAMADVLANMGNVYDDMNMPVKALELHQGALKINEGLDNPKKIANSLTNIGIICNGMSDFDNAYAHLVQAQKIYEQSDDKYNLSIALNETGKVYRNAPDAFFIQHQVSPSKRFEKALEAHKRSLEYAVETEALDQQAFVWEELGKTY